MAKISLELFAAVFFILIAFPLQGCHQARMSVDPSFAKSAIEWPVKERGFFMDESFSFGPYRVANVDRSATSRFTWGISSYSDSDAEQKYAFELQSVMKTLWNVECRNGARWTQIELDNFLGNKGTLTWGLDSKISLVCLAKSPDGKKSWKLAAQQKSQDMTLKGLISGANVSLSIEGTRALAGSSIELSEASGYRISDKERVLASLDVLNDGRLFISETGDKELTDIISGASAALLLYRDIARP